MQGTKRYATARKAASPELWCDACAKVAQERAEAQTVKAAQPAKPEQNGKKVHAKKVARTTTAKARKAA